MLDRLRDEYRIKRMTKVRADTIEELAKKLEGVDEQQFLKTIKEWNAAVMTEVPFNPAVKDGRSTRGLAVPKSNWANTIDEPPFEAYAVTCGLTFTFGGLKITNEGEVESTDGHADPRPVRRRRAGGRAVLSQLSRRHRPGVGRGAGQAGGRRRGAVRSGQELATRPLSPRAKRGAFTGSRKGPSLRSG